MKSIDYVFFRVYQFYKNKNDSNPILMGCLIVVLFLVFTLLSILALFSLVSDDKSSPNKAFVMAVLFISLLLFWFRYKKPGFISYLTNKYINEPQQKKRINGWKIVICIAIVLLIPLTLGFIRHNLGLNI